MDGYLKYGLPLFGAWIIVSRAMSLIYILFRQYPDLGAYIYLFIGVSILVGLLAVVAGAVIIVELRDRKWDITRVAMTFLGIVLIALGVYNVLTHVVFNMLAPSLATDNQAVVGWIHNAFRGLTGVAALLIIISLQDEQSVARMGLFLYSIVTIAGIVLHYLGMESNPGIGFILALIGIGAGVLIIKRV